MQGMYWPAERLPTFKNDCVPWSYLYSLLNVNATTDHFKMEEMSAPELNTRLTQVLWNIIVFIDIFMFCLNSHSYKCSYVGHFPRTIAAVGRAKQPAVRRIALKCERERSSNNEAFGIPLQVTRGSTITKLLGSTRAIVEHDNAPNQQPNGYCPHPRVIASWNNNPKNFYT